MTSQWGRHAIGMGIVVGLHGLAAYGLVVGPGQRAIELARPPVNAAIIDEVAPPPPPPPPPPAPAPRPVVKRSPLPRVPPPEVMVPHPQPAPTAITASQDSEPAIASGPVAPAAPATPVHNPVRVAPVLDASRACPQPQYPPQARRNGEIGVVMIRFLIDVDGRAVDSAVERSSGFPALDEAARAALTLCRFKPGSVDGVPERSWARLRYVWKLQ